LATAGNDGAIKLWNVTTGEELRTLSGRSSLSVAFSPDGLVLASGNYDKSGSITLWGPATGNTIRTLTGHTSVVRSVAISPDGKTLASAGQDGRALIWDAGAGSKLHDWQLPGSPLALAFAHDGRHLATANGNGTMYIFRLAQVP
jgi:WD40 repeat protein